MKPDNQQSKWLQPLPFFITAYLVLLVLAGSFTVTVGPIRFSTLGNTLMAFGIGVAVISFLATRTIPHRYERRSIKSSPLPFGKHIGLIFMASLCAAATGWLVVYFLA